MSVKKGTRSEIWVMLFAYLAISKIFYWFNIITDALNQGDNATLAVSFSKQNQLHPRIASGVLFCPRKLLCTKRMRKRALFLANALYKRNNNFGDIPKCL